ncbi:MAG: hypothetical protein GY856_32015 [bacterium]|nr:hypothetical protein [bacterium]
MIRTYATPLAFKAAVVFEHRATHPAPAEVPDPPKAWGPVYARMADADGLPWKNLEELVEGVRRFLDPVLAGDRGRWDPAGWTWR